MCIVARGAPSNCTTSRPISEQFASCTLYCIFPILMFFVCLDLSSCRQRVAFKEKVSREDLKKPLGYRTGRPCTSSGWLVYVHFTSYTAKLLSPMSLHRRGFQSDVRERLLKNTNADNQTYRFSAVQYRTVRFLSSIYTACVLRWSFWEGWIVFIVNCGMEKKDLIQVRNEYSPQPSKMLYNCKLKNKEVL